MLNFTLYIRIGQELFFMFEVLNKILLLKAVL